jgi:hypothetical protein
MAKIAQFSAPGNLKDFGADMAAGWSRRTSDQLDKEIAALVHLNPGIQPQFYNPSKLDVAGTPAPISWPAFPQIIEIKYADDTEKMLQQGELRDNQDEYLEWAVVTENNKITKVMFTCEGPEYWRFIATRDKNLLVKLYSDIAGQAVPPTDLYTSGGAYVPRNRWNSRYAVHLVQDNNTLDAEINIAASATVLRRHDGNDPVTDADELINCSGFGQAERHSDPHIGDVVNQKARQGCSITLQDPIALYLESLPHPTDDLGIRKPGGGVVGPEYWTLVRGDQNEILRAVFAAPAGQPAVGDLEIGGEKIRYGGQIVRAGLRVKLTGVVGKPGVFHNHSYPCPGQQFAFAAAAAAGVVRATRKA